MMFDKRNMKGLGLPRLLEAMTQPLEPPPLARTKRQEMQDVESSAFGCPLGRK